MIKAEAVVKTFDGFRALNGLNLWVKKGTVYGLVGPNGAGKTTIIKHLAGVYRQDFGSITISGKPIYENTAIKEQLMSISDDLFFFGSFHAKEMARFYSGIYPHFSWERYEKIKSVFNIDEKRQISRLSKGMKKQVAFWLAISAKPQVLILDEPVDGLDPVMRKQVWNLVMQDVLERGMTVLVSSHNLRELEDICDDVGIIHQGKMVMEKQLDEVKGNIGKYQVAFRDPLSGNPFTHLPILHESHIGSVYNLIIKGEPEEITRQLMAQNPVLCERVSLSLEEVFIYELGGLGYDFSNILI